MKKTKNIPTFNFNDIKILKSESNRRKRELHEMLQIQKNSNSVNDKKDVNHIGNVFTHLIQ